MLPSVPNTSVGAVEVPQLHPDPVVGVGDVDPDVVGERGEVAPGRAPAVHHVEHLVDAVGGQVDRERRERVGGQLGVAAVDERLVGLAAQDEGDVLVLGVPGPRLVGRVGHGQGVDQRGVMLVEERQQPGVVAGALGLGVVVGALGSVGDHPGPPVLHVAEVPEQVVGTPVRARRHGRRRVAVREHVAELLRLVADVLEVRRGVETAHAANLARQADNRIRSEGRIWLRVNMHSYV